MATSPLKLMEKMKLNNAGCVNLKVKLYMHKQMLINLSMKLIIKNNRPSECVLCGCTPKPDEWSAQVENYCFDCA